MGRVRLNEGAYGHLDVLAWNASPRRLARKRSGGNRRPMGEAWIASAPSHRERPAATQETQRLLRIRVDRASGYLAWRFDQTWATVLLPRLHTLSRIHDPRANGRSSRRGGPRRRRDRGVGLSLRTPLLQKTSLAVVTDKPTGIPERRRDVPRVLLDGNHADLPMRAVSAILTR